MIRVAGLLALLCAFSTGCGYHTAGRANLLPSDLRVLAVPAFVNSYAWVGVVPSLPQTLERLIAAADGALALVSGRSIPNLDSLFAPPPHQGRG